jgi:tetratricopeptide (TPR) repeat protein
MKYTVLIFAIILAFSLPGYSQSPSTTATPLKLSAELSAVLERAAGMSSVDTDKRATAYAKLLEAQRYIWRLRSQQTQVGRAQLADLARGSLKASLTADPYLSEPYVALAEIALIMPPADIDEAVALTSLAVKLNRDSIGGHTFLARLLTRQSGIRTRSLNKAVAARAIEEWREVTRLDPRDAEAWAMLGELFSRIDKRADAVEAYQRWMASTPPVDTTWYSVLQGGQAEDLMPENAGPRLAAALVAMKKPAEAIRVLADLLSDDPENVQLFTEIRDAAGIAPSQIDALAMLAPVREVVAANAENLDLLTSFAKLQARLGDTDGSIRILTDRAKRLDADKRSEAAYIQLAIGDILTTDSRFAEAVAAFEKSLSIRGLDKARSLDGDEREFAASAFDKLINGYKRAGKYDDARAAILRSRKLFGGDDPFADRQLILFFRESGDRASALAAVRSLRQRSPNDVTLLRQEATLLMESGQVDQAVSIIQQRIDSFKANTEGGFPRLDDDFSNYVFISQIYNEAGRGTDAAAAAQKAMSVAGSDDRRQIAQLMTATAYHTAKQYERSETILRDIIKASPRNPIALNNLGYFLLERGEGYPEALGLIERAIEIDPTNPSYLDSLGWAQFKNGMIEQALKTLTDATSYDDSSATIQEHLGDVYSQKGDSARARRAWQRATALMFDPADLARVKVKLAGEK